MLEFLLKYSPVVIQNGQFALKNWPSFLIIAGVVLALVLALGWAYRKTTLPINRGLKSMLLALKFAAIGLLLYTLLEPVITVSAIVPQKSSLLLLVDHSKSMSIEDAKNKSARLKYTANLLGDTKVPGMISRLEKNFKIQMFKFSSEVAPLRDALSASAEGGSTHLGKSLKFAAEVAEQGAVAGVLLFTDGANNGEDDPLETAVLLKNKNLPVYAIGVGSEQAEDIEISKVTANHSAIENSVVEIFALIKNKNFENRPVELELREDGAIVKKQTETLKGSTTRVTMKFSPQKRGFIRYTLNAVAHKNESIKENNSKSFLIDNRSKRARVLYIEGYPRAEFKYIRRALEHDESIELVSLLRTGPDKYYRQGIKDQNELKDGYPKTKEQLFKYDAIIFGSVEADFFSQKELENTQEFVAQRGGGFLMLGGVHSFAQGGYSSTPIEEMLPVELPYQNGTGLAPLPTFRDKFKLVLTTDGLRHPILQLSTLESENASLWQNLPELEGYNPLGRAKPGASILAVHPLSEMDNPKIILAQQRYGSGRTMMLATSSTWHWQMGMPHEDTSHERFWRQTLRWLALSSPKPLEVHADKESYTPFEQVTLKVDSRDSSYNYIEDATIKAIITTPSGQVVELPFNWSSNGKVEYIAAYHPEETGIYLVEISAYSAKGDMLGKTETAFFVESSQAEFSNAQLQSGTLKRIADLTGGKYYHEDESQTLPEEIAVRESSYSKLVEYDLWDMPLIFLLAIVILTVEWYARRTKGLS
jgi:uncharacterized membrane protein